MLTDIKIFTVMKYKSKSFPVALVCMFNLGDYNPGEIKNVQAVFCVRGNHHHSVVRQYNAHCKSPEFRRPITLER